MCAIASFFDNLNSPTPTAQVQVLNVNRFLKKQTEMSELVARTGRHQQRYEDGYRLIAGFLMLLAMRLGVLMDRFLLRYCTGYKKLSRVPEIMSVIWKRINDTGKNWRHVYKALTILEYLVAHGSERVIDEIREHAYQISALSDFQYIDSSGKDHGSNVRKKSQSLVVLVNDKERIQEARQKAAANRDKCC